jgi:hypothetical protein
MISACMKELSHEDRERAAKALNYYYPCLVATNRDDSR